MSSESEDDEWGSEFDVEDYYNDTSAQKPRRFDTHSQQKRLLLVHQWTNRVVVLEQVR